MVDTHASGIATTVIAIAAATEIFVSRILGTFP
jgi:hypothetical protein